MPLSEIARLLRRYEKAFPKTMCVQALIERVVENRPFAGSGHMVRNKLHWDASYAVGLSKKGTRTSPARLSFVLKVRLRNLLPSVIYSVPM